MQLIVTITLISLAALYVVWNMLRPVDSRKMAGCSSGCGGCTSPAISATGRLALPLVAGTNKIEA
jgi:hypothetical protein